ncbi:interleukin 17a/f3 [Polymixia lowei]
MQLRACQRTPTQPPPYKHHSSRAFRTLLVLILLTGLHGARKDQGVQVTRQRVRTVKVILDTNQQAPIPRTSASLMANMSLSPWTYSDTYEESRLPNRLYQARCQTSGCLSLQGGGEDLSLEAKPIYYQVLVLHRVQRGERSQRRGGRTGGRKATKKYDFRLETKLITVGCTCVRPSIVPQE